MKTTMLSMITTQPRSNFTRPQKQKLAPDENQTQNIGKCHVVRRVLANKYQSLSCKWKSGASSVDELLLLLTPIPAIS